MILLTLLEVMMLFAIVALLLVMLPLSVCLATKYQGLMLTKFHAQYLQNAVSFARIPTIQHFHPFSHRQLKLHWIKKPIQNP